MIISGKAIYVEEHGKQHADTLLYLHGGPGESCLDFTHQAKLLGERLRVIAFDQRGVLRSERIDENEAFGLYDIIEDCEAIRDALKIEKWSLLGHSFGGYLALIYALKYPDSITSVIFECPGFDVALAYRNLLRKALALELVQNDQQLMREISEMVDSKTKSALDLYNDWQYITGQKLGGAHDTIYYHHPQKEPPYDESLVAQISDEMWSRADVHSKKLDEEGKYLNGILSLLPELKQPSLLILGKYDPVCCEVQKAAYLEHVKNGKLVLFEHSAHVPRLEEELKYRQTIFEFLCDK